MVANQVNMQLTFDECNEKYFEGKLPIPLFDLLHSFMTCGYFRCEYEHVWFSKRLYNFCILMTDYYDFTEKQFVDIMVHEMIHYYLAYTGEDRRCRHGKEFKKIADNLNRKYGLRVIPYLDLSQYKRRSRTPSLSYWFVKKLYM